MIKSSSYEFWRGVGLDGGPVVAIAVGLINKSTNRKTGDGRVQLSMVQTYILRADMSPVDASNLGLDRSVCGDCDLRVFTWRIRKRETGETRAKCYVNLGWLTVMWNSWNAGNMPRISPAELGDIIDESGMPVRQGAYGDPAVVPADVWDQVDRRRGTSYSHQWRTAMVQRFAMASVTTLDETAEAQAMGYRTYRVDVDQVGPQESLNEITCPNQTQGTTCADCGLCNGQRGAGAKNIVIHPMGKFK
jgi:hypothetical protein